MLELAGGESTLAWMHLSHAGFITGNYTMTAVTDTPAAANTPTNPYNALLQIIHDNVYAIVTTDPAATVRLNIKTGNQIPSAITAEIDRKVDDGNAGRGVFRYSVFQGAAPAPTDTNCFTAGTGVWLATNNQANCGGVNLF